MPVPTSRSALSAAELSVLVFVEAEATQGRAAWVERPESRAIALRLASWGLVAYVGDGCFELLSAGHELP